VVTCPRCNSVKSDYTLEELGWTLLDVAHPEWDGLTRRHRPLWEAAGRPRPPAAMAARVRDLSCT
jgi:hypothetical protein